MHLIRQPQKSTLCGIACVAMIAEKSLTAVIQLAIELFKWDSKTIKTNSRTNKKEIVRLLAKYGFSRLNTFKNLRSRKRIANRISGKRKARWQNLSGKVVS